MDAACALPKIVPWSQTRLILHGVRLACLVGLSAKVRGSGSALMKIAGENRLNQGAENDLGAAVAGLVSFRCLESRS